MRQPTAILTVLLLVLTPVGALVEPSSAAALTGIDQGGAPGVGWVAYAFTADGATVSLESRVDGAGEHTQASIAVYTGAGELLSSITGSSWRSGTTVHTQTDLDGGSLGDVTYHEPAQRGAGGWVTITMYELEGPHLAILYVAGDAQAWSHSLAADGPVTLTGKTQGTSTFLYTARDFKGTASASASTSASMVRGQIDATLEQTIEGTLIGSYLAGDLAYNELWLERPGERVECPCWMDALAGPDALGPGSYTFGLQGTGADVLTQAIGTSPGGMQPNARVFLGGADIVLPT